MCVKLLRVHAKQAPRGLLRAVNALQGVLSDTALSLLADEEFVSLDVSHASQLSHEAFCTAMQRMPALQYLDMSHCSFQPLLLANLRSLCPELQVQAATKLRASRTRAGKVHDSRKPAESYNLLCHVVSAQTNSPCLDYAVCMHKGQWVHSTLCVC